MFSPSARFTGAAPRQRKGHRLFGAQCSWPFTPHVALFLRHWPPTYWLPSSSYFRQWLIQWHSLTYLVSCHSRGLLLRTFFKPLTHHVVQCPWGYELPPIEHRSITSHHHTGARPFKTPYPNVARDQARSHPRSFKNASSSSSSSC